MISFFFQVKKVDKIHFTPIRLNERRRFTQVGQKLQKVPNKAMSKLYVHNITNI